MPSSAAAPDSVSAAGMAAGAGQAARRRASAVRTANNVVRRETFIVFLLLKCNCDAQRRNRAGRRRGSGISDQTLALVPGDLGSVIVPTRRQSLLGTAMNVQALYASCGSTARLLALSQGAWEVVERPASSKNLNHQGPVWPPIAKSGQVW